MYNSLFRLNEHHLAGFFRNHAMINEAYKRNIPVVSDYIYKTADYQLYNRVREFMTSGITLDKACHKAGITIKRYNQIRPGVSGKSLEAVRKVFLDLKPDSLPQIRTATTGNDIFYYIVKDIPDDPSSVLRTGTRVLFIKNDSREFRAFYGFIGQKLDKDHQAMEKPESDG
jgi:hypothetical protein